MVRVVFYCVCLMSLFCHSQVWADAKQPPSTQDHPPKKKMPAQHKEKSHRVFKRHGKPFPACQIRHQALQHNGTTEHVKIIENPSSCCAFVCEQKGKKWKPTHGVVRKGEPGSHGDTFLEEQCVCIN